MAPAPSEPRSAHVHGDRGRPPAAQEAQRVAIRPYPVSRHQATRSADGVDATVPGEASTSDPARPHAAGHPTTFVPDGA